MAADFGLYWYIASYRKLASLQEMKLRLWSKIVANKDYPSVKSHRLFVLGHVASSLQLLHLLKTLANMEDGLATSCSCTKLVSKVHYSTSCFALHSTKIGFPSTVASYN